ncbi:enoyl-CoA hydratase/isomerase family protein [Halocatena marina]|uniref:Enoyl-CoA hydratase/isomerase family protein n=1 Tax=Halocatena marina TaxID=2934937 RepID=A0ABD5YNG8_9EURY|nr:enoyl-CoA hydratase-related protein [Halocatena marina]
MHEEFETVRVAFDEEQGLATLTLNRPDSLNAMNGQMRKDIESGLDLLTEHDEAADGVAVRAVVIEGTGDRAFCAGADITGFSGVSPAAFDPHSMRDSIIEFPAPVIAKIHGYCLGGGLELALACDFRIASESSRLGFPEVDLGLLPGAGGVQYVARLASPSFAKELAMTGEHISAERAASEGVLNHVYSDANIDAEVDAFVEALAAKPPLAIRAVKDSGNVAAETGLHEGRKYDRRIFSTLLQTDDHEEGARAFAEDDYEPEFHGR